MKRGILIAGSLSVVLITALLLRNPHPQRNESLAATTPDIPFTGSSSGEGVRNQASTSVGAGRLRKLIHKDLLAQIHDKLSAWKAESDREARDRLMLELLAMLTDENAAEIAQSLSPEDLAERFGVAALDHWLNLNPEAAATWLASRLTPGSGLR